MKIKRPSIKRILISALCTISLACAFLAYSLFGVNTADALTTVPDPTTVVTPLYSFDDYCYNESALDELAAALLGRGKKLDDLINYIKSDAGVKGQPVNDLINPTSPLSVRYGRYRFSTQADYTHLVWMPVYMSSTSDGEDAILTLYLASTGSTFSSNEDGYFSYMGTYADSPTCAVPSNMYGYSNMRVASLGNGGYYAAYTKTNTFQGGYEKYISAADTNKFDNFVKGSDFTGDLYDDIVSPSRLSWQANESYKEYIGTSYAGHDEWANYYWPNEAYDTPIEGGEYKDPLYYDYTGKENYDVWMNDKVWLPSLTEVGTGNVTGSTRELNGIWELTVDQRSNIKDSWLRTADTSTDCYHMFCTSAAGGITSVSINRTQCAIRPAIHLNLSAAKTKLTPPVNLPDTLYTTYSGQTQVINDRTVTLPEDQVSWFQPGKMHVSYYKDEACLTTAEVKNAGVYYIMVYLDYGNLYFKGEDRLVRSKSAKLVVEKKEMGIRWVYDNNVPVDVQIIGDFYEYDLIYGQVPELGIRYNNDDTSGTNYYNFDDLLRGQYTGIAYIKNEEDYHYNYVLDTDASIGDGISSNRFRVGRKIFPHPYFIRAEEDTPQALELHYRGKQYVRIANFDERYMEVIVSVETGSNPSAIDAEHFAVEGTSKDGIWTCSLSMVADYVFTVTFKDNPNSRNFSWIIEGNEHTYEKDDYETNNDTSNQALKLHVGRRPITVDFIGLEAEWGTINTMEFTANVVGIVEDDPADSGVEIRVWYEDFRGTQYDVEKNARGRYFVANAAAGSYTMYAYIAGEGGYTTNYLMDGNASQAFTVVQTTSSFGSNNVEWQYKVNGATEDAGKYYSHTNAENALKIEYINSYYEFSLKLGEEELRKAPYYVKATYSGFIYDEQLGEYVAFPGAVRVMNAGKYIVKATISAFYDNVELNLEQSEYDIYFDIEKGVIDLSGVKWDYDGTPLIYTGEMQKIRLDPTTVPKGLTAAYTASGNATSVGSYTSTVTFKLAEGYSQNYYVPTADDPNSYKGEFSFTCDWEIGKDKIVVEWLVPAATDPLFVPRLKIGHLMVNYSYEKSVNGNWVATDSLTATGANETFRISATLLEEFAPNYELVNNVPQEFEVASGKYPVTIHFEIDGEECHDGSEFVYTGYEMKVTAVVDGGDLQISNDYTVEYYYNNNGVKGNKLDGAPVNVGSYIAAVTATYGNDSYISPSSTTEVAFEIIKADYKLSELELWYEHGDKVITAIYDAEQERWVDAVNRQVILEFEYDGTEHEITLHNNVNVVHQSDLLTFTLSGSKGTIAGDYESFVTFTASPNFNSPTEGLFPEIIKWTITKGTIHFEGVRWGYIDESGHEYDRDFKQDPFIFTRDENKRAVKFTVGLIGLPEALKNSSTFSLNYFTTVKYATADSGTGSVEEPGNSYSRIGEYETRFTVSGIFDDPNYEKFDAAEFPSYIGKHQTWEIERRELTKIDFDDSWSEFDDRVHDIIELCGVPEEELPYFRVQIDFMDTAINVTLDYAGYKDVPYAAYHAGQYTVVFYELSDDDTTESIYSMVQFTVKKKQLDVLWYDEDSIPVARVDGVFVSDMMATKYSPTAEMDEETGTLKLSVTLLYVKDKDNSGVTFYASPYITEAYINDVEIKMANNEATNKPYDNPLAFVYEPFVPNANTVELERASIKLVNDSIEYNGTAITFVVENWEYFSRYLEVSDGSLTKTEIGDYKVKLSFKKGANACWKGEDEETYRSGVILNYHILEPTRWALSYPEITLADGSPLRAEITWEGENIEFVIKSWVTIHKFLKYEVFYSEKGLFVSQGTNLVCSKPGDYRVVFSIPKDSIGYWVSDPDNDKKDYTIYIKIKDPNAETDNTISSPVLEGESNKQYNGGLAIEFNVAEWDYYSQYLELIFIEGEGAINNGVISVSEIGMYVVRATIKIPGITFSDGSTYIDLTFRVTPSTADGVINELPVPSENLGSKQYTGEAVVFSIPSWASIYSAFLEIVCDDEMVTVNADGTVSAVEVGTYSITLKFKEGVENAKWKDGEQDPITLSFTISPQGSDDTSVVALPVIGNKEFTGGSITFVVDNWDAISAYVRLKEGSSLTVGPEIKSYTVTFQLIDPTSSVWANGSTDDITVTFEIIKATLSNIGANPDGTPGAVNGSGDNVNLDDYFDKKYYDPDTGEEVPKDSLEEGKKYDVEYTFKTDKEEEFKNNFTNSEEIKNTLTSNRHQITYEKPPVTDEGDSDSGLSTTTLIIIIVAAVLAVILLITIIAVIVKNRSGDDDDYDDYDDDYDDDDDDYDDYDDYDY